MKIPDIVVTSLSVAISMTAVLRQTPSEKPIPSNTFRAQIVRVIDADTFVYRPLDNLEILRLRGIDAPEPKTPDGAYSQEKVRDLIEYGEVYITVQPNKKLQIGISRDNFGRVLGDVYFAHKDGWKDLGSHMVDMKWAVKR